MDTIDPLCILPDLTLSDALNKCRQSCGDPKIDGARVILAQGGAGVPDNISGAILRQDFLENPRKLPCFRIVLTPEFSDPGLFSVTKEDCSLEFADNEELYNRLAIRQDPSFYSRSDREIIDGVPLQPPGLYCVSLETHDFITGVLEKNPVMSTSNVHPRSNLCVRVMPGINTSMYYVGGVNSCSEMHREDAKLAAVAASLDNISPIEEMLIVSSPGDTELVMKKSSTVDCDTVLTTNDSVPTSLSAGVPTAQDVSTGTSTRDTADATDALPCNLLLCVPDGQALESAAQKSVQSDSSFSDAPVVSNNRERSRKPKVLTRRMKKRRCSRLLDHKSCYVNTDFLNRHDIKSFTFRQYKDDVVYSRPGVYHQVIQLSPNCLEASNFGDAEWQLITGQESVCGCDDQKVTSIEKNSNVRVRLVQASVHKYLCDDCDFGSSTRSAFHQHQKEVHHILPKRIRPPKVCPVCGTTVARLSTHLSKPTKKHLGIPIRISLSHYNRPIPSMEQLSSLPIFVK
ncbi:hypothetical protein QAD02_008462 [Eretmocerus hayati]|uniref:Uncharacterized protein n=1 Tax=Eretmocerus hayati TaxID=131215 RepID=A0ACC2N6H6_9HYME|nr:hypothetical protein QAD02_008462 [Eretmocerus hayati]